jgi:hypothetical protein
MPVMRNAYEVLVKKLEWNAHSEDQGIDRIILKLILGSWG